MNNNEIYQADGENFAYECKFPKQVPKGCYCDLWVNVFEKRHCVGICKRYVCSL